MSNTATPTTGATAAETKINSYPPIIHSSVRGIRLTPTTIKLKAKYSAMIPEAWTNIRIELPQAWTEAPRADVILWLALDKRAEVEESRFCGDAFDVRVNGKYEQTIMNAAGLDEHESALP